MMDLRTERWGMIKLRRDGWTDRFEDGVTAGRIGFWMERLRTDRFEDRDGKIEK